MYVHDPCIVQKDHFSWHKLAFCSWLCSAGAVLLHAGWYGLICDFCCFPIICFGLQGRKILLELTTDFIAVQQKKIGKDNPHFQHGFLPCLSKLRAAGDAGKTMASRIGGYKMSHKKTKKNPRAHRPAETQEHGRKLLAEDSIGWGLSSEVCRSLRLHRPKANDVRIY